MRPTGHAHATGGGGVTADSSSADRGATQDDPPMPVKTSTHDRDLDRYPPTVKLLPVMSFRR